MQKRKSAMILTAAAVTVAAAGVPTMVEAEGDVTVELYDREGRLAASAEGSRGELQVRDAHLWQVRNAYLYTLSILLKKDGTTVDRYDAPTGIRTVCVEGGRIMVNGEPVYLKGFGKHDLSGRLYPNADGYRR